ncbi:MAG: hypothetical protein KUG64_10460, partial [Cycloclasticus sp.]|nr:hypothetical protein [Cycloclasticus sp.]
MAITIKVEPQKYSPVYNELMVVLDSTNKTEPKFQYVIDVNIGGVYSSRLKVQSNPAGYGVINLSKHIEHALSSDLDLADKEIFKKAGNSFAEYDVTLSEEYVLTSTFTSVSDNGGFCQYNFSTDHHFLDEDFVTIDAVLSAYDGVQEVTSVPSSTQIVTTIPFSVTSTGTGVLSNNTVTILTDPAVFTGDKFATNNVYDWHEVPNYDDATHIPDATAPCEFLTNLPSVMSTRIDDRFTMGFYQDVTDSAKYLKVTVDGTEVYYYENLSPTVSTDNLVMSVGCGYFDIYNASLSGTPPQAATPVLDGDNSYYTVELVNDSLVTTSEVIRFNIDRSYSVHENYRIMYLNRGGHFSTFNFTGGSSKKIKVKKTSYNKHYGSYDSTAVTYGWETKETGTTRLNTEVTDTYTINSAYLSEEYGDTIEELLASPEVYHLADNSTTLGTNNPIVNFHSNVSGNVDLEVTNPHGWAVGDWVSLGGTVTTYIGLFKILSVVNSTRVELCAIYTASPFIVGGETAQRVEFDDDGVLRAIETKSTSMKIKKRLTNSLIQYTINFEYSVKNPVQR